MVQAVDALGEQRGGRASLSFWSDGVEKEANASEPTSSRTCDDAERVDLPVAIAPTISPLLAELAAFSGGRVLRRATSGPRAQLA